MSLPEYLIATSHWQSIYSGYLKFNHCKSSPLEVLGGLCFSYSQFENKIIQNPNILVWISNGFRQNGSHLCGYQMVGLPDFNSYLKSGPFANRHFLTIWNPDASRFKIPTVLFFYQFKLSPAFVSSNWKKELELAQVEEGGDRLFHDHTVVDSSCKQKSIMILLYVAVS